MPFDGTGNYSPPSPPTFPAVNGEVIRSDYFNAIITDIANSLTLTFTKDGQSAPTAELDFNAQNLTNIDALDATSVDALNYFINGDLLDYTPFTIDFISATDAADARSKLGVVSGSTWGSITGTLSSQLDLQAALDAKVDDSQISAFGLTLIANANAADARADLSVKSAAELAASTGAVLVGTTDGNVQSDVDAAQAALVAVDARLDAIETITPTGENASDSLADLLRPIASGPREALVYNDADSVKVFSSYVTMGGFRFRGQYLKGRSPVFAMPSTKVAEYNTTGCPVLSAVKTDTWVAVFAVADSGEATATLRTMPFLRLAVPSGLVCNIIAGGENVTNLTATASHSWTANNNLAGAEVLIISENGAFSGKTTTITANNSTSVTLASVHGLAAGDFILVAPPGWDHFCYLGSFYYDSTEVRNFYDTGFMVKAKMVANTTTSIATGAFASATEIDFSGNISPLATGCIFASIATLSTASTGDVAEYFDGDSSAHTLHEEFEAKTASGNLTYVFSNIQMPFLRYQTIHYKNGGSLNASRVSGQLQTTGWFEP